MNVRALGRLTTPEQFGDIIVKSDSQGRVTRIRDIGHVELGSLDYGSKGYADRYDSAPFWVVATPGADVLQVEHEVWDKLAELKNNFPRGIDYVNIYDPTTFVSQSIHEVLKTIVIAIFLVVGVVYLFLQSWRATIIPVIAIPVSLVGSLSILALLGISINNLSLFGLVLAVGIVVDDAIVVVEDVERSMANGMSSREATHQTMSEVSTALIAIASRPPSPRCQAGAAIEREIAQAEALLKQARATLPPLRFALEQQLTRLDVLMAVQPGSYARQLAIAREIPSIPAIPGDQQPTDMLRRRPDIIAAERRLAASSERIGAAISEYYPKISLAGALGFDSLNAEFLFTAGAFQPIGGGALRWRLFDFGKVAAEVEKARGADAEALAVYRNTVLRAAEDVENALSGLTQTEADVIELRDEVQSLVTARDLAEQAYRAGSITLTDVLDADRQLLVAQDEYDANRANAARAAVGVFRALGGGWDSQDHIATRLDDPRASSKTT